MIEPGRSAFLIPIPSLESSRTSLSLSNSLVSKRSHGPNYSDNGQVKFGVTRHVSLDDFDSLLITSRFREFAERRRQVRETEHGQFRASTLRTASFATIVPTTFLRATTPFL